MNNYEKYYKMKNENENEVVTSQFILKPYFGINNKFFDKKIKKEENRKENLKKIQKKVKKTIINKNIKNINFSPFMKIFYKYGI